MLAGKWKGLLAGLVCLMTGMVFAEPGIVFEGTQGPGLGKHIVFVTGDEEYRSEESMPMLAKILADAARIQMHGAVRDQQGQRPDRSDDRR